MVTKNNDLNFSLNSLTLHQVQTHKIMTALVFGFLTLLCIDLNDFLSPLYLLF